MSTSCPTSDATARKNERLILQRLASYGQAPVAVALGVSESMVSRWKDGDIERFGRFLALLGLKVTPVEYRCYDQRTLEAMLTLARQRMDQIESVDQIPGDEP